MKTAHIARLAPLLLLGLAAVCAKVAEAQSAPAPLHVDAAELKRAALVRMAPLAPAQVSARYGATLTETARRFPDFKQAITGLDPTFFARQSQPDPSKAGRLENGREVLLLPGCRNMYLCDSTRYVIAADVARKVFGVIEQGDAPHSYLMFGKPDVELQNVLFGAAAAVLEQRSAALAKQLAESAKLGGIAMLPQVTIDRGYGDLSNGFEAHPDLASALRHAYPASGSLLAPDSVCGVRLRDGRELVVMSTTTSNADGEVAHACAYDARRKQAYVFRSDGQLGGAASFGSPDPALKNLLSMMGNCTNLRAQLGLDPNGTEAGSALAAPAASPAAPPAKLDFSNAGIDDPALPVRFLSDLQAAVAAGQKNTVAAMIAYPITLVDHGKKISITGPAAFLQKYDLAMNPKVKTALAAQRPEQLFSNYQGLMIGSGEIWFGGRPDGRTMKIVGINN